MSAKRKRAATGLPHMYLDTESIARKAEALDGVLTYASYLPSGVMISDGDDLIVVTGSKGYLVINKVEIPCFIEELQNIYDDMKRNKWVKQ